MTHPKPGHETDLVHIKPSAEELTAIGSMLVPKPEMIEGSASWSPVVGGFHSKLTGVHLGNRGQGRFVDSQELPVEQAGIAVEVAQGSHGPTSLYAKQLEGYKVQSGNIDKETGMVTWTDPDVHGKDRVQIDYDRGNLSLNSEVGDEPGNPGIRAGLVRVTNIEDGSNRHFAVGAKFEGKTDDWNVTPMVVEVSLQQPEVGKGPDQLQAPEDPVVILKKNQ